jgi:hypothetical protein
MKRSRSVFSRLVLCLAGAGSLALAAVNCGGGEETTGTAGTGGGGAGTGGTAACDVPKIFTTYSCALANACHGGATPAAGFAMDKAGWETGLVGKSPMANTTGVASACVGKGPYLVAGSNPATGLFIEKLSKKTPVCGERMPNLPGMELTAAEIACVQTWANNLTK